jgi:hypothetical protein
LLLTMLMPSLLLCLRLLSCFFIVSLLRQMSIALDNVSFGSCKSFFWVALSFIQSTKRSWMRESCKQAQKLQVCASFLSVVTYLSIDSSSLFCRLLKMKCLYV